MDAACVAHAELAYSVCMDRVCGVVGNSFLRAVLVLVCVMGCNRRLSPTHSHACVPLQDAVTIVKEFVLEDANIWYLRMAVDPTLERLSLGTCACHDP